MATSPGPLSGPVPRGYWQTSTRLRASCTHMRLLRLDAWSGPSSNQHTPAATVLAGNGTLGVLQTDRPSTNSSLGYITSLAPDPEGQVYVYEASVEGHVARLDRRRRAAQTGYAYGGGLLLHSILQHLQISCQVSAMRQMFMLLNITAPESKKPAQWRAALYLRRCYIVYSEFPWS